MTEANASGSANAGSPDKNAGVTDGNQNASADAGSANTDDNIDLKALLSEMNALKEKQALYEKELEHKDKLIGQQGDEIGELKKFSQAGQNNQQYAEMLKSNWESGESEKQLAVTAKMITDVVNNSMAQRNESVRAFYETVGDSGLSFSDVEGWCALNNAPLETSKSGMRKTIDRIRIEKASSVDINKLVEQRANELFEKHKQNLHPANLSARSPNGGNQQNTDEGNKDFNANVASNAFLSGIKIRPD